MMSGAGPADTGPFKIIHPLMSSAGARGGAFSAAAHIARPHPAPQLHQPGQEGSCLLTVHLPAEHARQQPGI